MQQGQRRKVDKNPSVTPTIINVGQKGMRETKASKWQYIDNPLLMAYRLARKESEQ